MTETRPGLHNLLIHHVVNTLGWPSLRPLQQQAVGPLTSGVHALLIAPTAGGKTEAAMFPTFSRVLEEERRYGRCNYLDLTAVFADPPTLTVVNGRTTIGQVHVRSLLRRGDDDQSTSLLIAGRDWTIVTVDWKRRVVHVTPATGRRGRGAAAPLPLARFR